MAKLIVIWLLFAIGVNFLPKMQAKIVNQGGFGRLLGGFSTEEGVYGQLFDGIATVGNDAVCGILGSHFLPTMSKNHHCPQEYLAPNTFDSFKNLCECLRCKPELQNCIKSAALTIPLGVPGVTDYTVSLGQCCNLDLLSREGQNGFQVGNGLLVLDIPRNPDALANALGYGATDKANDILCTMIGPNFLRLLLTDSRCTSKELTPDACETRDTFCDRFRNENEDTQKCLSDASIEILARLKGIVHNESSLGTCCARCPEKEPTNPPPPTCKPNPPVIVPKC